MQNVTLHDYNYVFKSIMHYYCIYSGQDYNNSPPVEIVLTGFSLVSSFFAVSIPITDDEINEPEEGFLLVLELVSAVDPSLVDLSARNASICRIQDNDRKLKP